MKRQLLIAYEVSKFDPESLVDKMAVVLFRARTTSLPHSTVKSTFVSVINNYNTNKYTYLRQYISHFIKSETN